MSLRGRKAALTPAWSPDRHDAASKLQAASETALQSCCAWAPTTREICRHYYILRIECSLVHSVCSCLLRTELCWSANGRTRLCLNLCMSCHSNIWPVVLQYSNRGAGFPDTDIAFWLANQHCLTWVLHECGISKCRVCAKVRVAETTSKFSWGAAQSAS